MSYVPFSPQTGARYVIYNPANGVRVAFNNPADPDNIGMISEVTGLDSADVRESAEDLASADGGSHGDFFYGRRPIVISGLVYNHATAQERDLKLDKLRRATNGMRNDISLIWDNLPVGSGLTMMTPVRRQQPLRIGGGWNKDFQLALVSEFSQLFGYNLKTSGAIGGTAVVLENQGDAPANPIIRVTNVTSASTVINDTTGQVLKFTGPAIMNVDIGAHTASEGSTYYNDYLDFNNTTWPQLRSGDNSFRLTGPGSFAVTWRDTWS